MNTKHLKNNILTKTYQGILKPNQVVRKQFQFISKGCNEIYNCFLKKRIKTDKKNQPQPTAEEQQKELTKLKKKSKYQWLNKIPAWTLQEVVKNRLPNAWNGKSIKNINQSTLGQNIQGRSQRIDDTIVFQSIKGDMKLKIVKYSYPEEITRTKDNPKSLSPLNSPILSKELLKS